MREGSGWEVGLNEFVFVFFFFQAEDGIRDVAVTGVQTCALPLTSLGEEMQLRITDARGRVVFAPNGEMQPLTQTGQGFDPELKAFAYERGGVVMRAGTATLVHDGTTWHVQIAVSDRMVDWLRE